MSFRCPANRKSRRIKRRLHPSHIQTHIWAEKETSMGAIETWGKWGIGEHKEHRGEMAEPWRCLPFSGSLQMNHQACPDCHCQSFRWVRASKRKDQRTVEECIPSNHWVPGTPCLSGVHPGLHSKESSRADWGRPSRPFSLARDGLGLKVH